MRFFSDDSERFFPTFTRESFYLIETFVLSQMFFEIYFLLKIQSGIHGPPIGQTWSEIFKKILLLVRSGILICFVVQVLVLVRPVLVRPVQVRGSLDLGKDGIFFISLESSAHLFSFFQSIRQWLIQCRRQKPKISEIENSRISSLTRLIALLTCKQLQEQKFHILLQQPMQQNNLQDFPQSQIYPLL